MPPVSPHRTHIGKRPRMHGENRLGITLAERLHFLDSLGQLQCQIICCDPSVDRTLRQAVVLSVFIAIITERIAEFPDFPREEYLLRDEYNNPTEKKKGKKETAEADATEGGAQ